MPKTISRILAFLLVLTLIMDSHYMWAMTTEMVLAQKSLLTQTHALFHEQALSLNGAECHTGEKDVTANAFLQAAEVLSEQKAYIGPEASKVESWENVILEVFRNNAEYPSEVFKRLRPFLETFAGMLDPHYYKAPLLYALEKDSGLSLKGKLTGHFWELSDDQVTHLLDFIRAKWKEQGLEKSEGQVTPSIVLLMDGSVSPIVWFKSIVARVRLIGARPLEEPLISRFTEGIAQARHIRGSGMHFVEDRPPDNDLQVDVVRAMIPLLLAWPESRRDEFAPIMPGYDGRRYRFRDLMLWGLADMIDPRIHDSEVLLGSRVSPKQAAALWPKGSRQAIQEYMTKMLKNLEEVDELGQKTGKLIPENNVRTLLLEAAKTKREWLELGYRMPGEEADTAPQHFSYRLQAISGRSTRSLRDPILNFPLISEDIPWKFEWNEMKPKVREEYTARHGSVRDSLKNELRILGWNA